MDSFSGLSASTVKPKCTLLAIGTENFFFKSERNLQKDKRSTTFGRETSGRRHLGARTFGREMRCSALFTTIFLLFSKNFTNTIFTKVLYFQPC